jgi:hypothetical protein
VAVLAIPLYALLGARQGVEGLAIAGSVSISANAVATLALARKMHGAPRLRPVAGSLARTLAATLPGAGLAWLVADVTGTRSGLGITPRALLEVGVGGATYLALALPLLYALGDAATRDLLARLPRRLRGGRSWTS